MCPFKTEEYDNLIQRGKKVLLSNSILFKVFYKAALKEINKKNSTHNHFPILSHINISPNFYLYN